MKRIFILFRRLFPVLLVLAATALVSQNRFPKPEFESDYQQPRTTTPAPRAQLYETVDTVVLGLMLAAATWFALRKRSRKALFIQTILALLIFGFWRKGCVCAVGSLQNVTLALFNPSVILPVSILFFFTLPLITALFFGRSFCASVCPLGAVQELILIKPLRVPGPLNAILGVLPKIYLGLAVLFAATGAGFIICRFDPFVSLFRMSGPIEILILGLFFLVLGTVVGRPYCRFLCPYGVLLGWMSTLSRHHVTITPDTCIQCRLCEDACPYGAIRKPVTGRPEEKRRSGLQRLALLLVLTPAVMFIMGAAFSRVSPFLARAHYKVRLAERIRAEDLGKAEGTTLESDGFRSSGVDTGTLYAEAGMISKRFRTGSRFLGGFIGLVLIWPLIGLSVIRRREDYTADPYGCFSCGRCFMSCPQERVRIAGRPADRSHA